MDYLSLYSMILLASMISTIILFTAMWIYEKDKTLIIWLIGTSICAIGILGGLIGYYSNYYDIGFIGHWMYYIGEGILIV